MPRSPVLMLLVFALTLFASATLLFMVEPMIGKMILPLLGGTPAVWNTCMVFFQAVLLLGYGYAHLSTTWLGARKQAALHLVLLALPFMVLPVAVNQKLIKGDENPVFLVLLILSLTVGLPMFVVSASAPLLQKWFASTSHPAAKDPYFLYGASNLGSMLTLIAYPLVVEPNLRLDQQSFDWTIGYGFLVTLTAACAVLMWLSPRNVEMAAKPEAPAGNKASEAIQPSRQAVRTNRAIDRPPQRVGVANFGHDQTLTGAVTWPRILRWVALAFVPSSLMLGATTYITTDIAAIPLLWVAPLALYLLSFILVFSKPAFQWGLMVALNAGIALILAIMVWNGAIDPTYAVFTRRLAWAFVGLACGSAGGGLWSWKKHDSNLQHRVMILVLPLLVLALLFFMLSEIKTKSHWIGFILSMHLVTLFVVSMVCHGELARDRPAAKDLTGYFLWMSVGGVLGGLFNGLLAPLIFNGIVEYELAMMLACFLAPPLGPSVGSKWGRRADLILAGLFVMIAAVLIALRLRDHDLTFEALTDSPWPWQLAALLLGLTVAAGVAVRARAQKFDHWMDLALPLCLGLLLIGLSWGLFSDAVWVKLAKIADSLNRGPRELRRLLTYGVPLVMCYTFVERPLRFALGIGAILLASSFLGILDDRVLHQERSFFGVLKVENEADRYGGQVYVFRRLIHGTTLHGMQCLNEGREDEPLTYYHITGPIGQVMQVYNKKTSRQNLAVIGLGTGTMASYAHPGQHLTFYDIDPVVRRLSFDEGDPYFTFVDDARKRGAWVDLVMGDARLTMERKELKDSEKYGVIVVDAFSSDAIPIHLMTREALKVYLDKMTERGLLCFHISNRYLDLKPVLYKLAEDHDPKLAAVFQSDNREENYPGKTSSTWVVLARKSEYLDGLRELNKYEDSRKATLRDLLPLMLWPNGGHSPTAPSYMLYGLLSLEVFKHPSRWEELEPEEGWPDLRKVGVWTDDYSNLLSVFSW